MLDENMIPKRIRTSWVLISLGVVIGLIGITLILVNGIEKYIEREDIDQTVPSHDVKSINIDVAATNLNFQSSATDEIIIKGENIPKDFCQIKNNNGELKIYRNLKIYPEILNAAASLNMFGINNDNRAELNITIPDKLYDEIKIKTGSGENNINNIMADYIEMNFGVGENNINNVKAEETYVNAGIGKSIFKECIFGKTEFDCGIGDISYSGEINNDLNINCGIGDTEFSIDGYYNNYDIKTVDGIGKYIEKHNSEITPNDMIPVKIDIGIGNMDLEFTK